MILYCWGDMGEHILHNAKVVAQYVIMNSYVSCMDIWIFRQIGIAHVIQTSEQLDNLQARRVLFSWHGLEIKFTNLLSLLK